MKQSIYEDEWKRRIEQSVRDRLPVGAAVRDADYREAAYAIYPGYLLFCFCEKYRAQHATAWQKLEGILPAHLYLIDKHHWLPGQVAPLDEDELLLLLHQELAGLRIPVDVRDLLVDDFRLLNIRDLPVNQAESA